MPKVLSKLTAALLAVLLLYYFPMLQNAKRQEDITQLNAYRVIAQFVDTVRNKGYITADMYNEFNRQLGTVMNGYELEMEHRHKKYVPEYKDAADSSTFLGSFSVQEEAHYLNEITESLFPSALANKDKADINDKAAASYELSEGDYFDVRVRDTSLSSSTVLGRLLYGEWVVSSSVPLEYGGMVLNEDY